MSQTLATRTSSFFEEIVAETSGIGANLNTCIQCGTCGGSCPSAADMDQTPRTLFAMINEGLREDVLKSNTPWYCVSCYYCMSRCPQDIHITDIMYALKRMAIEAGYYQKTNKAKAPEFSETFIGYVENNGRSFELGVASRYHLRYHPLGAVKMATGFGLKMITKGRMDFTPPKIKGITQLKAILKKSKELGGEA
ncbi:MAG: 4Fe-4S dicluster domain-containing protein [Anaerolineales bacterium]|jgi:heterodisulfide reductase subunit C